MAETPAPLVGTPQSRLASDYLNHEFGTTFKTELYGGTLDWYNEGSRLKEITKEMTVMEQLRNLILYANEARKLVPHDASEIQHSQDSKVLFVSPDSRQMEEVNISIFILDNAKMRKSESIWHSRHSNTCRFQKTKEIATSAPPHTCGC
jgi:hypothetical protein